MLYVIWGNALHLPGTNHEQYCFDVFPDRRSAVNAIAQWFEIIRESMLLSDQAAADKALTEVLGELDSLSEDPNIENTDLTNMTWVVENDEVIIYMAEEYPDVLDYFRDVVFDMAEKIFQRCYDLDEKEICRGSHTYFDGKYYLNGSDYYGDYGDNNDGYYNDNYDYGNDDYGEEDELLNLYLDIRSLNLKTPQEEFDRIFNACSDLIDRRSF